MRKLGREGGQNDAGRAYAHGRAIGITFTDQPVPTFGSLTLFVAFADRLGLATKLEATPLFTVTSPSATPPHQVLLAFFAGVLAGARGFAELAVLPADEPIRQLFGLRASRAPRPSPGSSAGSLRR